MSIKMCPYDVIDKMEKKNIMLRGISISSGSARPSSLRWSGGMFNLFKTE